MTRPALLPSTWRRAGALLCLAIGLAGAGLLASCGGDVGTGGTGAPSSYASGRISGFGSVVVNGVHYDDDASTVVVDDDGVAHTSAELRLGMTVRIDAGEIRTDTATGTLRAPATAIHFGDAIAGPVTTVDPVGSTFTVLGQTVVVDLATVFGGYTTGLAGVVPGDLVEVFAFLDTTTGRYHATRVEKEATLAAYLLQGQVSNLDAAHDRFTIGTAVIDDSGVSSPPALAGGVLVRVQLGTTPSGGAWPATRVSVVQPPALAQDTRSEIEGLVSDFVSLSDFQVDGVAVNAGGAGVQFVNGTSAAVANGARVEVEGSTVDGVLVATKVDVSQDDTRDAGVDLQGQVSAVDHVAQTFVLRGQTVSWTDATVFSGVTAVTLKDGDSVEVHGHLNATGDAVIADTVARDN